MKKLIQIICFLLTWNLAEAVKAGVVSYHGQGRDKYGN